MADHQAPSLNINATTPQWFDPKSHPLHILSLKPFSSLRTLPLKLSSPSKPPWPELFKLITSNHAPLPKPSQNQITTKTQKPTKSQIKITPTEIKAQNNQNHKMKTLKVNPPLKKHILVLLLYFRRRIILLKLWGSKNLSLGVSKSHTLIIIRPRRRNHEREPCNW